MMRNLLSAVFLLIFLCISVSGAGFSFATHYSSNLLYLDEESPIQKFSPAAEIEIVDIIPHIGIKFRASQTAFTDNEDSFISYKYIPLTLVSSFDLLPFVDSRWLQVSMETGFGIYLWKGLRNNEIITLPQDAKMREKDFGFVGGFTIQSGINKFFALVFSSRYNYIASSDIYKYGFPDKDEKIWENSLGIVFILK